VSVGIDAFAYQYVDVRGMDDRTPVFRAAVEYNRALALTRSTQNRLRQVKERYKKELSQLVAARAEYLNYQTKVQPK
jgi:hemerythrin-like domain-containing protein